MYRKNSFLSTILAFITLVALVVCLPVSASSMELLTDEQMQGIHGGGINREQCNSTSNCASPCALVPGLGHYGKGVAINHPVCGASASFWDVCINWKRYECSELIYYNDPLCSSFYMRTGIFGKEWGC